MPEIILLCTSQSEEATKFLEKHGELYVPSFSIPLYNEEGFENFQDGYEFVSRHTPGKPAYAVSPMWTFPASEEHLEHLSDINSSDGDQYYAIVFKAEVSKCLFTDFDLYNEAFAYGPTGVATPEEWDEASKNGKEDELYEVLSSMKGEELENNWIKNIIQSSPNKNTQVTTWVIKKEDIIDIYPL